MKKISPEKKQEIRQEAEWISKRVCQRRDSNTDPIISVVDHAIGRVHDQKWEVKYGIDDIWGFEVTPDGIQEAIEYAYLLRDWRHPVLLLFKWLRR